MTGVLPRPIAIRSDRRRGTLNPYPGFTSKSNPEESVMTKQPKPSRGMPRSLLYALIPGGFLLLVLILVLTGFWSQEPIEEQPTVIEQPDGVQPQTGAQQQPAAPQ